MEVGQHALTLTVASFQPAWLQSQGEIIRHCTMLILSLAVQSYPAEARIFISLGAG